MSEHESQPLPEYLSARQAAKAIGVSTRAVIGWCAKGEHGFEAAHKLPGVTGRWRIPGGVVTAFIEAMQSRGRSNDQQNEADL